MTIHIGCSAPPFLAQKGRKLLVPVPITLAAASGFASGFVRVSLMSTSSPPGVLTIQGIPGLWTPPASFSPGAIASVDSPVFSTAGALPAFTAFAAFFDGSALTTPTTGYGATYQIEVFDSSNPPVLQGSLPFELTGDASAATSVDVVFAVDHGYSMARTDTASASRLARLQAALSRGVRLLRDDDKLGVVSFANVACTSNPQLGSDFATVAQQDAALGLVNALAVDEVTPLSKPIQQGINFARQLSQTATVVLVTDGTNNNTTGAVLTTPTLPTSAVIIGENPARIPASAALMVSSGGHYVFASQPTLGEFAIEKLLTQLLIGLAGSVYLSDPDGSLKPGESQTFPLQLTEADHELEVIVYSNDADALQVHVEVTRALQRDECGDKRAPKQQVDKGVVIDRVLLKPPRGPDEVITPRVTISRRETTKSCHDQVRFNLLVAAKTDLMLDAQVAAAGLSVGSDLLFSAVLSEYGRAWARQDVAVKVELTHPDGYTQILELQRVEGAPERFQASLRSFRAGAYRAHFIASGTSLLQKRPFRRECVRTIAVYPPRDCCPPEIACNSGYAST